MPAEWKEIDKRLIKREEPRLELSFIENYPAELDSMNHGKRGPPLQAHPPYIQFLTAIHYLH